MTDAILIRQLQTMGFMVAGLGLVVLALYLRLRVFIGTQPGGVDTWYYLASADAIREQKRLPISLPQYLLHERSESYPAVFPVFLALLPREWLRKYFWLLAPVIDCCHLLLLYLLCYRLTDSVLAAATAGLIYAVTPQLISETRNLNGRAFASLLLTLTMLLLIRGSIPSTGPTSSLFTPGELTTDVVALVMIALLYNTHTSTTIAFIVTATTLSIAFDNPRFFVLALLGLPTAIVISGGYYLRVIRNHVYALRFWIRNVRLTRAHQVEDSPVLQRTPSESKAEAAGLYATGYRARLSLGVRLFGENPFVLPMLITPIPNAAWAAYMYWWAVAVFGWALATTFIPPLRILGPGFHYMKASVFPTAYVLAVSVNIQEGAFSPVGLLLLIALLASFGALAYFYRVMAVRRTEHTAHIPPDLFAASQYLRGAPGRNVLVLPTMYADYIAYDAIKSVVWGGHSGNLDKFEEFFPVLRQPIEYFFDRYQIDYLVLDLQYTTPDRLGISERVSTMREFGSIVVYQAPQRQVPTASTSTPEPAGAAI